MGPVLDNLDEHVAYQTRLEREGVMFAAGLLSDDAEQECVRLFYSGGKPQIE